jgi:hypothetical protein
MKLSAENSGRNRNIRLHAVILLLSTPVRRLRSQTNGFYEQTHLLQLMHASHALLETSVVHGRRGLVRLVDGILVAQLAGSLALLINQSIN